MAKRKPIKLKVGVMPQIIAATMSVWRACHWNADTLKENEIRQYIFDNKLNKMDKGDTYNPIRRRVWPQELPGVMRKMAECGYALERMWRENGRYVVEFEHDTVMAGTMREADYRRLQRMERSINKHPDLRRAVRAAMEHDDVRMGWELAKMGKDVAKERAPRNSYEGKGYWHLREGDFFPERIEEMNGGHGVSDQCLKVLERKGLLFGSREEADRTYARLVCCLTDEARGESRKCP